MSDKGCRSAWPARAFLCLFNNGILSDTDTLPVCHFYSLIFCPFCLCVQTCVGPTHAPSHKCLCAFLSSDCYLQSGRIVPAAAPHSRRRIRPATFHFTLLTSSGSDRWKSESKLASEQLSVCSNCPAAIFERALPLNCYHLRAHVSRSQVPWNIYSSVALHTKATGLECPQLFYFSPSHRSIRRTIFHIWGPCT